jgi:N-acetylmuramoyl-L-alanine amidase
MKLEGYRVCLEAGHGYHDDGVYDPGAVANGYEEHNLNVAQVERVAKLLEAQGCKVTKGHLS